MRRPSALVVRSVLAFAATFVVASVAIRLAAPPNPDFAWHPTFSAKVDHLRTTTEHYDVVFVGDSRTYRGIDPVVLDAELDALGCPANTYNLGTLGMSKFEYDHMMEALAATPGGTPEIIVNVEVTTLLAGLIKDFSLRNRGHMSAADAQEYLEYKSNLPAEDFGTDPAELLDTAAGFAVNQIPIGAVHQQLFEQAAEVDGARRVDAPQGFQPGPEFEAEAGPEGMANLLATLTPELENGGWEQRWAEEDLDDERLDQWLHVLGAHMDNVPEGSQGVQLFLPSFFDEGTLADIEDGWAAEGRQEPIVNLVDTDLIGDYTDPTYFLDFWHLSPTGSEIVSKAAARELCPLIQREVGG
ncbi:MAG: hypothetical protein AAGE88_20210 [Actinomycetota bacterium]